MRSTLAHVLAVAGGLAACLPAFAQSGGYRDRNGVTIPMVITGCIDANNRAVPCAPGTGGGGTTPPSTPSSPTYTSPVSLTAAFATIALPQGTPVQLSNGGLRRFSVQVQGAGRVQIGFDNTVCSTGYRLEGVPAGATQGVIQPWYPANGGTYWGCAPDAASSVFVERGQ